RRGHRCGGRCRALRSRRSTARTIAASWPCPKAVPAAASTPPGTAFLPLFGGGRRSKSGYGCVRHFRLQPRINVAREIADAAHRLVMFEVARLAHDQQVAEAADVIVHFPDLRIDLIRRA